MQYLHGFGQSLGILCHKLEPTRTISSQSDIEQNKPAHLFQLVDKENLKGNYFPVVVIGSAKSGKTWLIKRILNVLNINHEGIFCDGMHNTVDCEIYYHKEKVSVTNSSKKVRFAFFDTQGFGSIAQQIRSANDEDSEVIEDRLRRLDILIWTLVSELESSTVIYVVHGEISYNDILALRKLTALPRSVYARRQIIVIHNMNGISGITPSNVGEKLHQILQKIMEKSKPLGIDPSQDSLPLVGKINNVPMTHYVILNYSDSLIRFNAPMMRKIVHRLQPHEDFLCDGIRLSTMFPHLKMRFQYSIRNYSFQYEYVLSPWEILQFKSRPMHYDEPLADYGIDAEQAQSILSKIDEYAILVFHADTLMHMEFLWSSHDSHDFFHIIVHTESSTFNFQNPLRVYSPFRVKDFVGRPFKRNFTTFCFLAKIFPIKSTRIVANRPVSSIYGESHIDNSGNFKLTLNTKRQNSAQQTLLDWLNSETDCGPTYFCTYGILYKDGTEVHSDDDECYCKIVKVRGDGEQTSLEQEYKMHCKMYSRGKDSVAKPYALLDTNCEFQLGYDDKSDVIDGSKLKIKVFAMEAVDMLFDKYIQRMDSTDETKSTAKEEAGNKQFFSRKQIVRELKYLMETLYFAGIVHCNLCFKNIGVMCTSTTTKFRLLNFEQSKVVDEKVSSKDKQQLYHISDNYMSYEMAKFLADESEQLLAVSHAWDMCSFGWMCFELLIGKHPFEIICENQNDSADMKEDEKSGQARDYVTFQDWLVKADPAALKKLLNQLTNSNTSVLKQEFEFRSFILIFFENILRVEPEKRLRVFELCRCSLFADGPESIELETILRRMESQHLQFLLRLQHAENNLKNIDGKHIDLQNSFEELLFSHTKISDALMALDQESSSSREEDPELLNFVLTLKRIYKFWKQKETEEKANSVTTITKETKKK